MTQPDPHSMDVQGAMAAAHRADAGTMLREAREAAGLSIDMVSQQLKLAPRQVRALEEGDYPLLPGRTFVRGFARNYARLLQLDPQMVLDALPGAPGEGGLEAPPLHPTAVTIGELPSAATRRPGWLPWTALVVVVGIMAGVLAYQHFRPAVTNGVMGSDAPSSAVPAPAPAAAPPGPAGATGSAPDTPLGTTSTPLPNPLAGAPVDASAAGAPAPGINVLSEGAAPPQAPAGAAPPSAPAAGPEIAPLSFALKGPSWLEVKDSTGHSLISQTVPAGQTQALLGTPPFEIVIGNASGVTLSYRGKVVDLAPHSRGNVARLTLQ